MDTGIRNIVIEQIVRQAKENYYQMFIGLKNETDQNWI